MSQSRKCHPVLIKSEISHVHIFIFSSAVYITQVFQGFLMSSLGEQAAVAKLSDLIDFIWLELS